MPPVGAILDAAGNIVNTGIQVADTVGGPAQYQNQQGNESSVQVAPEATQAQGTSAVTALPAKTFAAQQALVAPALYEAQQGQLVGQGIQQQGQNLQSLGVQQAQLATQQNQESIRQINNATIEAERQMNTTAQAAMINPEQYLQQLGPSGRTLTALGLFLSGAGAGLTGQPNMAYDMLQKSIQRDITSQQQNFLNQSAILQQQRGLITNAQSTQMNAIQAQNAAQISVATGGNVALQGLQLKIGSAYAPAKAAQAGLLFQQQLSQGTNAFDQAHVQVIKNTNQQQRGLYGTLAEGILNHFTPGVLPSIGNSAQQSVQSQQNNPTYTSSPSSNTNGVPNSFLDIIAKKNAEAIPKPKQSFLLNSGEIP